MWFIDLLTTPSAIQAVIVLSAVCALGLSLAKFRFKGISLGITFVFFAGILAGALGLELDPQMLSYAESFGLVLFVYTLGLQVGPGFMSAFKHGGTELNVLSVGIVLLGTLMTLVMAAAGWLPFADLIGVLCGATTNTPALGAAQQTLKQLGQPSAVAALSCAVTYPIGMIGVIIVLVVMKGWLKRHEHPDDSDSDSEAFITSYGVCNPALFGLTIYEIVTGFAHAKFVVSRIWREGEVILPGSDTVIQKGDRLLVITQKTQVDLLTKLFGSHDDTNWMEKNIDWNTIDPHLVSRRILITRSGINGKRLRDLHLRNRFGVTVSRVKRADLQLLATPELMLRIGDRIRGYLAKVNLEMRGPQLEVSRVAPEMLKQLFTLEVPEIGSGIIEIMGVARDPGLRAKIAVRTFDPRIDPVGACVGPKGSRVRMVVEELRNERVDVIQWSDDPAKYVANALSPARVTRVTIDEDKQYATVVVPDDQLSLAIGKEGQNARLAARLTGWHIDIKSSSYAGQMVPETNILIDEEPEDEETEFCSYVSEAGVPCRNHARPGSRYCGIHAEFE